MPAAANEKRMVSGTTQVALIPEAELKTEVYPGFAEVVLAVNAAAGVG